MRGRMLGIAIGMYTLSLLVPALVVHDRPLFGGGGRDVVWFGMHCLGMGFFVWPGWLANPLVVLAWLALARGRARGVAAAQVLATIAIGSALLAPVLIASLDVYELRYPHVGYFLWLGSIVLTAVAAYTAKRDAVVG